MAADVDSDVPDSGAAFTFGRCRFADNVAGKFWIKEDPILQIACGDEHTAVLTASGRLFTFGSNEWGQLGHGHTRSISKPSFVKGLKTQRVTVVACGRSHTLVATAEGHVFSFGSNSEGQLGAADEQPVHLSPVRVQGLEGVTIKMLSGGAEHSLALTDKGIVFVWGSGAEGQIGPEAGQISIPTELNLECKILCIAAGYYHSAFVTVDGKLYMCGGEGESSKLGLPQHILKKSPLSIHCVPAFDRKVTWVSCGGNHTIALTCDGKAYSFGNGYDGQLGLGSRLLDISSPHQIVFLENVKVARVSCGENHSAFLTDRGQLFTCGNGRHGKLGLFGVDDNSNQFVPTLVSRFNGFQVQQVVCGGCHTMVLAVRQKAVTNQHSSAMEEENLTSSARERRRQKNAKLSPLPPLASQVNKSESFSPTLKAEYRQRLPSMSKGAVWYVTLKDTVSDVNQSDEDDNEVLTKLERKSILAEVVEDKSIRHVDSDVDTEDSEESELNKTHTLVRIDNTILVRPTIPDNDVSSNNNSDTDVVDKENLSSQENRETKTVPKDNTITKEKEVKVFRPLSKELSSEEGLRKSHFYDSEVLECKNPSSSSKESKHSAACVML